MALWEAGMSDRHLIWNPAVLHPSLHLSTLHLSTCPPDSNCGFHISSGLERKPRNSSTTSLIGSFSGLREAGSFYSQWRCCCLCQSIVSTEKLQPKPPEATAQMLFNIQRYTEVENAWNMYPGGDFSASQSYSFKMKCCEKQVQVTWLWFQSLLAGYLPSFSQ